MLQEDYDEVLYTVARLDLTLSKELDMTLREEQEVKKKIDALRRADFFVHTSDAKKIRAGLVERKLALTYEQRKFLMHVLPSLLNKRKEGLVSSDLVKTLMNAVNLSYDTDVFIIFHEGDDYYPNWGN